HASHKIVEDALQVLVNLAHRGAQGSDPDTGDGAGMLLQMPDEFFRREARRIGIDLPSRGQYGVGMVFLPQDAAERAVCEGIIEATVREEGQRFLGWRDVPVDESAIGVTARNRQPRIRQAFVATGDGTPGGDAFERKLYVIRKVIERRVLASTISDKETFYVCTLSSNKVVYKGLLLGTQLKGLFPDLSDPELMSAFALVHSRFSTNTLGSWKLAHPYRHIVHNGEINTLRGNINWMTARQDAMASPEFGDDLAKLFPIITAGGSDTAAIDNAIELLLATGRPLHHVMAMLIPEATGQKVQMSQEKRDFYAFQVSMMEPWDGPALIAFTDGTRLGAVLDRNGLRPFRYLVTKDDLLVMASEAGVLDIPPEDVLFKARIEPGRMFLLDPERGGIVDDVTIKQELANAKPYGRWLAENRIRLEDLPPHDRGAPETREPLTTLQRTFGYTEEELGMLLGPMATDGSEAVGSMGNDTPLAVLSKKPQLLFAYFKQLFAQVSNPPLDAIREELVTDVEISLGAQRNIFDEAPENARQLLLPRPIITDQELTSVQAIDRAGLKTVTLSILFPADAAPGAMEAALERVCEEAVAAIGAGASIIVLSDRGTDRRHVAVPSLLATAGVHHHLIREGLRTRVGLVVESAEPREVSHIALLIGYGAGAVNPYLAYATVESMAKKGRLGEDISPEYARANYVKAVQKGLLKVISKNGISTIRGYCGAQIFEVVGFAEALVNRHFKGTPSRVGGFGLEAVEMDVMRRHAEAYPEVRIPGTSEIDPGGAYYWRRDGEYHQWNPDTISKLQYAARMNDQSVYKEFAEVANAQEDRPVTLRGLLGFRPTGAPIPIDEVEPAVEIVKRFATGAISLGSISREAHETLAIAMNRIGARSNSGEGGEDFNRYTPDENGDLRRTAIKQVASGRFGVTTNYLVNATDLQIKMAQGAKPGEGGQLPGHKVDDYIGWIRHSTPGVELISPPPHHDIYSIEDLAQLIHDLKNVNPIARIHVKLVSEVGVGTIAAGVAKAKADVVLISGGSGGTGASPESSIKHAGLPWELGIAEAQQVLVQNDLRGRIVVQADGQIKTGRDVAIAFLLGADEVGIGTASLITLGCIMLRKCHLNTCSVGIATQDPELRSRFAGQPNHLINYFFFVAEEVREIMAGLGFRTAGEMVGRTDALETRKAIDHWKAEGVHLSSLLYRPVVPPTVATSWNTTQDHGLEHALDHTLISLARDAIQHQKPVEISLPIRNVNRTVGAMLSGEVARRYGEEGLPDGTIQCSFRGSAGQSFAAFLTPGLSFSLEGESNDYFGKGVAGGRLVVIPPRESRFVPETNIIIGNVALYGATGGEVFIRGMAGERFGVRNSGARAVIEGIGDHGCEYMTSGRVVVLGPTGRNFAAGMSGGIAYVLDESGDFDTRCNHEMVDLEPVTEQEDRDELYTLIVKHHEYTGSATAKRLLDAWDASLRKFVKVYPSDYRRVIEARRRTERALLEVNRG
ncbi:MAG: glutamate synthase large subunit, partial [Chloroflexi bacterium]|nr:glutamate synthase large subunit [Chloroflexota bacterium]